MIIAILDEKNIVKASVVHDPERGPRPDGIECDDSVVPGMEWDGKQFRHANNGRQVKKPIQDQIDELRALIEAKKV